MILARRSTVVCVWLLATVGACAGSASTRDIVRPDSVSVMSIDDTNEPQSWDGSAASLCTSTGLYVAAGPRGPWSGVPDYLWVVGDLVFVPLDSPPGTWCGTPWVCHDSGHVSAPAYDSGAAPFRVSYHSDSDEIVFARNALQIVFARCSSTEPCWKEAPPMDCIDLFSDIDQ